MSAGVDRREGQLLAGKYQLESRLGVGGMGEVYRATNLVLGRTVAIKVLKGELAQNPDVVARFMREARAASLVRHPHVVDVLDVAEDEAGVPFIVQEFLQGCDLADAMTDHGGRLPPHMVLQLLLPVLEAVANAHAKGVVHRDLKPENIFLANTEAGVVAKVLDFGISKVMGDGQEMRLTATGAAMGTPAYMSPEQIRATKHVDARTDVWALGVILHEVLSGRLPYEAETHGDLFVKICTEKPASLLEHAPDVPAEFSMVVDRCLMVAPEARYSTAQELARDLQSLVPRYGIGPAFKHLASRSRPTPTPATAPMVTPSGPQRTAPGPRKSPLVTPATVGYNSSADVRESPPPNAPRTGQHARVPAPSPAAGSTLGFDPSVSSPSIARRLYRGDVELTPESIASGGSVPGAPAPKVSPDVSMHLAVPLPNRARARGSRRPPGIGAAASQFDLNGASDDSGGVLIDVLSFAVLAVGLAIGAWMALHTDVRTTPGVVVGRFFSSMPFFLRWIVSALVLVGGLGIAQRGQHTTPPRYGLFVAGGGVVLFAACSGFLTFGQHWVTLATGGRPTGLATTLFPWGLGLLPIGLGATLLYSAWERWRYGEGTKPVAAAIAAAAMVAVVSGFWIAGVGTSRSALLRANGADPYGLYQDTVHAHEAEPPPDPGVTMAPPRRDPPRPTPTTMTETTAEPEVAPSAPEPRRRHGRQPRSHR